MTRQSRVDADGARVVSGNDRSVHAEWEQMQVVRYDRAGKWYLEPSGAYSRLPRQQVTLDEAARYAVWLVRQAGGVVHFGVPGGRTFDHRARHHIRDLPTERATA